MLSEVLSGSLVLLYILGAQHSAWDMVSVPFHRHKVMECISRRRMPLLSHQASFPGLSNSPNLKLLPSAEGNANIVQPEPPVSHVTGDPQRHMALARTETL